MKMFKQGLLTAIAGGALFALTIGFAGPAKAVSLGGNFDVDQSCGTAGPTSPCSEGGGLLTNVDHVTFNYTATVDQKQVGPTFLDGNDPFVEEGFMTWTGYINDGGGTVFGSFLNTDYRVYGVFSAAGVAGLNASSEIVVDFTSFHINFYMDDSGDTTLTEPSGPTPIGTVTVTDPSADDALLGTANLLGADQAFLRSGLANGDFEVILTDLGLSVLGSNFLTNPNPFYNIMNMTGVTTSVTGASAVGPFVAKLNGAGDLFFPVPEPGTLSLLGLALLGLGMVSRRGRSKATS